MIRYFTCSNSHKNSILVSCRVVFKRDIINKKLNIMCYFKYLHFVIEIAILTGNKFNINSTWEGKTEETST